MYDIEEDKEDTLSLDLDFLEEDLSTKEKDKEEDKEDKESLLSFTLED